MKELLKEMTEMLGIEEGKGDNCPNCGASKEDGWNPRKGICTACDKIPDRIKDKKKKRR